MTDYTIANDTIPNTQLLCDDTIPKTQLITQILVNDTILTTSLLGNDTILTTLLLCNDTIPITHAILVHQVLFIPIGMVEKVSQNNRRCNKEGYDRSNRLVANIELCFVLNLMSRSILQLVSVHFECYMTRI